MMAGMTKERHLLLLAVAAVSLAAALAACDQAAPAAGGPVAAPAAGGPVAAPSASAPAAEPPGLRTETLIVAIVADDASPAGSLAVTPAGRDAATQTTVIPTTTLTFPSDFGAPVRHTDYRVHLHYEYSAALPYAGITRRVIERGGVTPWTSINGGASWRTGGFELGGGLVTLGFEYRAGDAEDGLDAPGSITIHLSASGVQRYDGAAPKYAAAQIRDYLQSNSLLIRFFIITDQ